MMSKNWLVLASLLAVGVAHASDPVILDLSSGSASFIGSTVSQSYEFTLDDDSIGEGRITSSFGSKSGYHITSVTFDGVSLVDLDPGKFDNFLLFDGPISAGLHTFTVKGVALGGSYSGNIEVTPVPEPETYGLALAGLVCAGFMLRRRQQQVG